MMPTATLQAPDRVEGREDTGGDGGSLADAGDLSMAVGARGSPRRRRRSLQQHLTPATALLSTVRQGFRPAIRVAASYRMAALAGPCAAMETARHSRPRVPPRAR